jgi:uncharacterized protein (DUF1697 family)
MGRQIALLRGINLGKSRRVAMADLRALMHDLGYADARTLLQSGNVVFSSSDTPGEAARRIRARVARDTGVDADVIVRTRDEVAGVLDRNPLAAHATDPKRHLVLFLAEPADPAALAGVDAADYEPERFAVDGREVHLWYPDGIQKARLTHSFWEKRLGIVGTARNWSTVEKLLALADEEPARAGES